MVILHLDSLPGHHPACTLNPLVAFLEARLPADREVHVLMLATSPRQPNKVDCGFFMLKAVEKSCEALRMHPGSPRWTRRCC